MGSAQDFGSVLQVAAEGAGIAWALSFIINAVAVAPLKAYYRIINPISLNISDEIQTEDYVSSRLFKPQNATLLIRNRSDTDMLGCSIIINGITDTNADNYPRLVSKFDLPAKRTRQVAVAYWTVREPPHTDDVSIGICSPPSGGFDSGLRISTNVIHQASLELRSPDMKSKTFNCRIWVDKTSRHLKATILNS